MKIIIVGGGRTGQSIIKNLSKEKHDIVLVDINEDCVKDVVNKYDVQGLCGNGCVDVYLKEAGVDSADLLISVTDSDEQNILICLVGKALGVKNLIAHLRNPNYYAQFNGMRESFGINMFVNPDASLAKEITKVLRFPSAVKVSSFSKDRLEIAQVKLNKGDKLCSKTLMQLRSMSKYNFLIVAVERNGKLIFTRGDTRLREDDTVSICARHDEMKYLFSSFGLLKARVQSVLILGSNADAYYLAEMLSNNGFTVKLIGRNYEKCVDIRSRLNRVAVICDDFTDKEVLDREGIANTDALVAMSSYDENNIVASLYAKSKKVPTVITVVKSDSYKGMLEEIELDSAVSPYGLAGAEIAKYVRSIDVPTGSQILSMQKIAGDKAEALQFDIGSNKNFVGKLVRELNVNMVDGVLIVAVSREDGVIIPDGNTLLQENDLIVITSLKHTISKLEDLLK